MKPVGVVLGFGGVFFIFHFIIIIIFLICLVFLFKYVKTGIIINCMGVWSSILKIKVRVVFPRDVAADSEIWSSLSLDDG